jgi:hypothetical protein
LPPTTTPAIIACVDASVVVEDAPMRLPHFHAVLLAVTLAAVPPASAQVAAFDPRTGDAWVDSWLSDINRYARAYREPFVDELVRYHRAPRELVVELLARPGWTPADVYYACSLAAAVGRPCRQVVDEYERDRAPGWGALARRLGVEPGSAQFRRVKGGLVPTYDRWGRPIQIDTDLQRDFPGRPLWRGGRDEAPREGTSAVAPGDAASPTTDRPERGETKDRAAREMRGKRTNERGARAEREHRAGGED